MLKHITRTVWIISLISLFNDFSSEMLYPILPLYLTQIGYGSVLIGILEGVAECLAGLTKIYMGSLSDGLQRRLPFVQLGYFLSILSRPLIGLSSLGGLIFGGRSLDRIGKGIRSGARDALLADASTPENRAEVFGFHRSMDTAGAVLGPLAAMAYLYYHPASYQMLFLITLIPGIVAILFTFGIREKAKALRNKTSYSLRQHFSYFGGAPKPYRQLLIILLVFSLVNSSDMFLLLRAKEAGFSEQMVLFFYLLFNLSFTLFAWPVGRLADRLGRMKTLIGGLGIYALSYALFAVADGLVLFLSAFILYGLFYAGVQGIVKVLLIERAAPDQKSSAIGLYEGLNSFTLLAANALAGWVWYALGAKVLLLGSAGISLVVALVLLMRVPKNEAGVSG